MKKIISLLFAFVATALAAAAQMLEITSSGVGIGTSTPSTLLHVRKDQNGQTSASVENRDLSSGNQVYASFRLFNGNSNTYGMYLPGQNSTGWQVVTANRLALYTNNTAGMSFDVDAAGPMVMATSGNERLRIDASGNVGIGTTSPGYKLEVVGSVRATSFVSDSTTYADFVFKPGYPLCPLPEVEAAIRRDGHLPDVPSEADVKAHGVDLANQQAKLLQKVEELTLYAIEQNKRIETMQGEIFRLRSESHSHP